MSKRRNGVVADWIPTATGQLPPSDAYVYLTISGPTPGVVHPLKGARMIIHSASIYPFVIRDYRKNGKWGYAEGYEISAWWRLPMPEPYDSNGNIGDWIVVNDDTDLSQITEEEDCPALWLTVQAEEKRILQYGTIFKGRAMCLSNGLEYAFVEERWGKVIAYQFAQYALHPYNPET